VAEAPNVIRFPEVARPDVTVVMLTFNRWDLTKEALRLLAEVTEPRYEVVVVDNASTDGTLDELDRVEGARILRNPRNLGFGPANNQGAAMASGRYLLLLNSDAWVRPGWLEPLIDVADADPAVAAVAPKLVYPDGRLQEAGSIIWRDGRVRQYGDGDRSNRPEYNFRRTVDYASAVDAVVGVMRGAPHDLLESLAAALADAVLVDGRVEAVTVRVRKLRPPLDHDVGSAGVRLHRMRPAAQ